ncbi:MAG: hypothetical protein AAFN93_11425 [Bacteroidota bacterium]
MLQLLKLEKRTLIKGWIICFIVVLPFTFLPVLSSESPFWQSILDRVPWSVLYSAGFALLICGAALYHNYERQSIKLKLFSKPAFRNLRFQYQQSGKGSLVDDLSFYITGTHNEFYYTIDMTIDLDDHSKQEVVITPMLEIEKNSDVPDMVKNYKSLLKRDLRFTKDKYRLQILLRPDEIRADDPLGISKYLNLIESKMKLRPI